MPRYISLHTLACLTRQGPEHRTMRLAAGAIQTASSALARNGTRTPEIVCRSIAKHLGTSMELQE
jgi:hypothetical protein